MSIQYIFLNSNFLRAKDAGPHTTPSIARKKIKEEKKRMGARWGSGNSTRIRAEISYYDNGRLQFDSQESCLKLVISKLDQMIILIITAMMGPVREILLSAQVFKKVISENWIALERGYSFDRSYSMGYFRTYHICYPLSQVNKIMKYE
jgi:hypothetical protein